MTFAAPSGNEPSRLSSCAVEIRRKMTGVDNMHGAIRKQLGGQTGSEVSSGAPNQALVQHGEHDGGIEALIGAGANGADEHCHEHGCTHPLAGDVADHDEQAAVRFCEGLEEVSADGLRRTVLSFYGERRRVKQLWDEHALLQLLRLFHVQGDDLSGTRPACLRTEEAARHQRADNQHHEYPRDVSDREAEAEEEIASGDTEGGEKEDIEAGELDQQQGKRGQQGLCAIATKTLDENEQQQHAQCCQARERYRVAHGQPGAGHKVDVRVRRIVCTIRPASLLP